MKALALCLLLVVLLLGAGCTQAPSGDAFTVDGDGRLRIALADGAAWNSTVVNQTGNLTLSRVVLTGSDGVPVTAYVGMPPRPRTGVVYVPGANEPVSGHLGRFSTYADAGIAFLYLDVRGNGFETPGEPFDRGEDLDRFRQGEWPQYYSVVADVMRARAYLEQEHGLVSVWSVGSSNGGRYAAVAAAVDPAFAGYAGVSTSGLGTSLGSGDVARRFRTSIDPAAYIGSISPRPVILYHAEFDPVIPYADGQALFRVAREPKTFVPFPGSHGIDPLVDADLIGRLTQVYAP